MKSKSIFLTTIMVSFLFLQCQRDYETTPKKNVGPNFPVEIKEWGEAFASDLNCKILEVKQNQSLKGANIPLPGNSDIERYEKLICNILNLSKLQLKIIGELAKARINSKSYVAFSNKLVEITDKIYKTIPTSEQAALLYITSSLYFGLKEINELAKKGLISGKAEDVDGKLIPKLKSASSPCPSGLVWDYCYEWCAFPENIDLACIEPNSGSWWNDPSSLAGVWAIAIAEPTPIGEAVALVLTGIIGSYLIITRADCIIAYVDCTTYTPNKDCSTCLHRCVTTGDWNCN